MTPAAPKAGPNSPERISIDHFQFHATVPIPMNVIIYILTGIVIICCLLLILVVLMQRPKQEGLGAAFGAGVTDQIWGSQTTNVLQKFTVQLTVVFFVVSLLLSVLKARESQWASRVAQGLPTEKIEPKKEAPATPPTTTSTPIQVTPQAPGTAAPAPTGTPATPTPAPATPASPTAPAGNKEATSTPPTPAAPVENKAATAPAPGAPTGDKSVPDQPAAPVETPKVETPKVELPAPAAPATPPAAPANPEAPKAPGSN